MCLHEINDTQMPDIVGAPCNNMHARPLHLPMELHSCTIRDKGTDLIASEAWYKQY